MKTLFYYICLVAFSYGCEHHSDTPDNIATRISVIIDPTDPRALLPTANPVLTLFACEAHPDEACVFRLSVITDKKLNPSFSSYLPTADSTEKLNDDDDAQFRKRAILTFYSGVRKNFSDAYREFDTAQTLAHSECWSTITQELHTLVNASGYKQYLIIASDLMERSDALDAYTTWHTSSAPSMAEALNAADPLPENLSGITVIFLYKPQTRLEDQRFQAMLDVYNILAKKGAVIRTQATNISYDNVAEELVK